MLPEDEGGSFVDDVLGSDDPVGDLHDDSSGSHAPAADGDGKGAPDGGAPASIAGAPNPEVEALKQRVQDLSDDLRVNQQRLDFFQNEGRRGPDAETKAEPPKRFEFKKEEWAQRMQDDPVGTMYELADKIAEDKIAHSKGEIEQNVDGKLNRSQQQETLRSALVADSNQAIKEFGDLVDFERDANGRAITDGSGNVKPLNPAFSREADIEFQERARARGNPRKSDGSYYPLPGDITAAAAIVAARWAKAGKLPKGNDSEEPSRQPIRRVFNQIEQSDNLGSRRNGNQNKEPATIDDLVARGINFHTKREGDAARKWIQGSGISEERYVKSILRNIRNGNIANN